MSNLATASSRHHVRMSRPPTPLPSALGPVFTTRQARTAGVTPQRLRAQDIETIDRGMYLRVGAPLTSTHLARALATNEPRVVIRGSTAAELLGMPLPFRVMFDQGEPVHLSTETTRRSTPWIRWHVRTHAAAETIVADEMRLTSRVRTWCDLAAQLTVDELVVAADHLVRQPRPRFERRNRPYATLRELAAAIANWGRPWSAKLREALALARVGSDSGAETALRLGLGRASLPEPALNVAIWNDDEWLGEPDLHWEKWKVCAEHEGPSHLDRDQQAKDIRRTERRTNAGWIEVRTTATDLHGGAARATQRVASALRRHGWNG
jgi:hypothetical protein